MRMKLFLIFLKNELCKMFPEVEFGFNLSKRKKNVHIGLPMTIFSYTDCEKFISAIEGILFQFLRPTLIHTSKWKFDYIFFERNCYIFSD